MPEKLSSVPWLVKIIALVLGGIICLLLSGDIDKQGKLQISLSVILKFISSVGIGLFFGEFFIEHLNWEHLNIYAQSAILMSFSIFGMLLLGILYRSIQLTLHEKTLSEIINEIKQALKAIFK